MAALIATPSASSSAAPTDPARLRARVIQVLHQHLASGDLVRASAQALYWSERLEEHPYLEPVITRAFAAIRRAQHGLAVRVVT